MNVEIKTYFYGERGLIDSLLLDLYTLEEDKQVILFNKIFKKEYKKYSIYVEPSFGQRYGFGVPDLIIKADNDLYMIEAKCGSLEKEIYEKNEVDFWNNSSKLNVQLLLRYRFFELLKSPCDDEKKIVKEKENDYNDSHNYRALGKEHGEWIIDIRGCDNIYFVALTGDINEAGLLDKLKNSYNKYSFNSKLEDFKKNLKVITFKGIIDTFNESRIDHKHFDSTKDKFGYYKGE